MAINPGRIIGVHHPSRALLLGSMRGLQLFSSILLLCFVVRRTITTDEGRYVFAMMPKSLDNPFFKKRLFGTVLFSVIQSGCESFQDSPVPLRIGTVLFLVTQSGFESWKDSQVPLSHGKKDSSKSAKWNCPFFSDSKW